MGRLSEIANTVATGQRCDMEKNSTAPREDHPFKVIPLSSAMQEGPGWQKTIDGVAGVAASAICLQPAPRLEDFDKAATRFAEEPR